ncbi:PREDICTED: vitellogenin-like [Polistes dominula]|uniref:Vitellogenin-like n=1 Tax=Polistes dominula TaxID=743375 RepID=A0ABM1JD01_POLDO|nr:PREDICTED: vitellogenin-like [Polistes dominula]
MRSPFILLLLAGIAAASSADDDNHGWTVGKEYQYLVRSRTLTGLETLDDQYVGILMKAILRVQYVSTDTFRLKLMNPQYAKIHKKLPDGSESYISDQMLEYEDLPLTNEPFIVKQKHNIFRELIVSMNLPVWEINIIKSIVSQLQTDTQGENVKRTKGLQIPENENPFATFHSMEDSISGRCEVLYDIVPLAEQTIHNHPELLPNPKVRGKGELFYITKTKNYEKCDQRIDYYFGLNGNLNWESDIRNNDRIMKKTSTSYMVLSGTLKDFIVQSAVTTTKVIMKPRLADEQESIVMSKMNVTLVSVQKATNQIPEPIRPISTGNLIYTYNDPFSETERQRLGQPGESYNSMSNEMNSNSESNEELQLMKELYGHTLGHKTNVINDEDKRYWQKKPTLQDAPRNPFLPLFIGNKGKAVLLSDKVDSTKMVSTLAEEIVNEIENPNTMSEEETLEKFTIICRLISSMSLEQINNVERNLHSIMNENSSDERTQIKNEDIKALFHDAVASAGTGPALMTIKRWIEEKQIKESEAAEIVSALYKTARTPTAEYVDTLFEMANNPEIQKQMYLNSSMVLSFAELVYLTQVSNNSMFNFYPVNVFGRLSSKQNDAVLRKYIPFLAEQLRKAIKDGDSPRIQVYIIALGITAHPKILSVFEPYLEGKEQVSNYQRFLMVMSLRRLADVKPSLARSVLYKIYLNTWDVHYIRCAAVYLLMKTSPPLDMLTRMAQFTNYDYNRHVISAVKSMIENAAKLPYPEWQGLASNARKVLHLLNPVDIEYYDSQNYFEEVRMNDQLSYRMLINFIGSEDSILPMSMFFAMKPSYNDFLDYPYELGLSLSSVKSLLEMYWHKSEKENVGESPTEKIAKMLNIQSNDVEQVEGTFFYRTPYLDSYLAFDNHTIERVLRYLMSSKHSGRVNKNKWLNHDMIMSFPTETGLPFVYALHRPVFYKISGAAKPDMKSGFELRLLMCTRDQGRTGFITPFDHEAYVSGIDTNLQIFLPFRLNYNFNSEKHRIDLTIRPSKEDVNKRTKLVHYSEIPYTSQYDLLSLRPLLLTKNTHRVESKKPTHIRIPEDLNSVIAIEAEGENLVRRFQKFLESYDKWDDMATEYSSDGRYKKIDIYVKSNLQENEAIKLFVVWDYMQIRPENDNSDEGTWESGKKVVLTDQYTPDSPTRRKTYMLEASKGMNSGDAFVVDVGVEIPGKWGGGHVLTWCMATSDVENKYRSLSYMHVNIPQHGETFEICTNAQMKKSAVVPFDYQKILNDDPMVKFSLNIKAGTTCSEGKHIAIEGKMKQTEDYKTYVRESSMAKKCKESHKNRIRDCQGAINMARKVNGMEMTINFDSEQDNDAMLNAVQNSNKLLKISNMQLTRKSNNKENNEVMIQIKLSPDMKSADGKISIPGNTFTFTNFEMCQIWNDIDTETDEKDTIELTESCTIENDEATTFDGKVYPLRLGKCPHVLLTTYPKHNPNKYNELWYVPEHMKLSIVAQEMENNKKEVRIQMGNDEVVLRPTGMEHEVMVNGQKVKCSQKQSYQQVKNDEVVYEIYKLPGPAVKLSSTEYDLDLVYDGDRVQIEVPDTYRKSIRGLCGDYDGRPENDFITPKNCILQKPEEFASTYILKERCEGNALKHAKKAMFSKCVSEVTRFSDVISDEEAGRPTTNWKQWGYHKKDNMNNCHSHRIRAVTKENKICFTMRPVPMCASGCKPNGTRQKKYYLHCLPKNEQSLALMKRVEKGANPDFSQRTPTGSEMLMVPVECVAA